MLTSNGYNGIMRKYLSEPNNYNNLNLFVYEVNYFDNDTNKFTPLNSAENFDYKNNEIFLNCKYEESKSEEQLITFSIIGANALILYQNGFFDKIEAEELISVKSTEWIYMDTNFFFIAEVNRGDIAYLEFDTGLNNIVEYINSNKSLL